MNSGRWKWFVNHSLVYISENIQKNLGEKNDEAFIE